MMSDLEKDDWELMSMIEVPVYTLRRVVEEAKEAWEAKWEAQYPGPEDREELEKWLDEMKTAYKDLVRLSIILRFADKLKR